jgi:glycine/D-amino acid oxidase-like deaminating enzyme
MTKSIAVIGCGIFGALTAIRLADKGAAVTVFERNKEPLKGASYNNQNRLHLGFHYPRDDETAKQCIRGFQRFRDEFSEAVYDGFRNAYFIAANESFTSSKNYLNFCDRLGLRYEQVDPAAFEPPIHHVEMGVVCEEAVFDSAVLASLVRERLNSTQVVPCFERGVDGIYRDGTQFRLSMGAQVLGRFDSVVNCTYADVNRLTQQLGHPIQLHQYEYTIVPIIEWDMLPVGITVMDGPFMTVLPFGNTGKFLLYHVEHSVIARTVSEQMPTEWLNDATIPSANKDKYLVFERLKAACSVFVPALSTARLVGFLQGPRIVLANRDDTDARPSLINKHEDNYISVFTGKIDHCTWVADEVAGFLL